MPCAAPPQCGRWKPCCKCELLGMSGNLVVEGLLGEQYGCQRIRKWGPIPPTYVCMRVVGAANYNFCKASGMRNISCRLQKSHVCGFTYVCVCLTVDAKYTNNNCVATENGSGFICSHLDYFTYIYLYENICKQQTSYVFVRNWRSNAIIERYCMQMISLLLLLLCCANQLTPLCGAAVAQHCNTLCGQRFIVHFVLFFSRKKCLSCRRASIWVAD